MIAENTTHFFTPNGMQDYGSKFEKRWVDLITPPSEEEPKEEDNRSSEEIVNDIWARIRGH